MLQKQSHDGLSRLLKQSYTCSYHGFQYELSTGICLTVPEVQLKVHAVRVSGTSVEVRLEE